MSNIISITPRDGIRNIEERKAGLVEIMDSDLQPGEVREHPRWYPMNAFSVLDLSTKIDIRLGEVIIPDVVPVAIEIEPFNAVTADISHGVFGVRGNEMLTLKLLSGESIQVSIDAEFREWCLSWKRTACSRCAKNPDATK